MKKITAFILTFSLILTVITPPSSIITATASPLITQYGLGNIPASLDNMKEEKPFDYEFLPVSAEWKNVVSNQPPATFSNVTYQLADGVVPVGTDVTQSIASAGQLIAGSSIQRMSPNKIVAEGAYVPKSVLDSVQAGEPVKPGTVYADVNSGTAFKVVSPIEYSESTEPFKDTYAVTKPELSEILTDFELPEQTVNLTLGNITGFAKNVEECMVVPGFSTIAGENYFRYLQDPMINLQFPKDTELEAYAGDGISITVILNGALGIGDMQLTGKYSGFGGYRIGLSFKQEAYLEVALLVKIDKEIRIPIYGFDIGFGIGKVAGGLFIVVDLEGNLRLEVEARAYVANTIGMKGNTAFYVPVTFLPLFEISEKKFDGDVRILGKIDGALKAGALVEVELFGIKLVGVGAFVGAGLTVTISNLNLDIEVYALVQAYIAIIGKTFNLVNLHLTLLEKKQRNTGGCRISILETFLQPQRIGGFIEVPEGDSYIPKPNGEYRVKVIPKGIDPDSASPEIRYYPAPGNNNTPVYALTNNEGVFYRDDVQFINSDKVCIEFKLGTDVFESDAVSPTLPFKKITVMKADYFNDFVTGQVEPYKAINWNAPVNSTPEQKSEMLYYQGNVTVTLSTGGNQAIARVDQNGFFNTAKPQIISNGKDIVNSIDVRPESKTAVSIDVAEATVTCHSGLAPTISFEIVRVIDKVDNSYKQYQEGKKTIDQMAYNERIWLINLNGERVPTDSQFSCQAYGFSTQDLLTKGYFLPALGSYYVSNNAAAGLVPAEQKTGLTEEFDENDDPTGSTLFQQRVTTEWVWQPHSNPVAIKSPDHKEISSQQEGSFQIVATGVEPLIYSIENAPVELQIDNMSGLITIPSGIQPGNYVFKIRVEQSENISGLYLDKFEVYKEDTSPPAEQQFTLSVLEDIALQDLTSATSAPDSATPDAAQETLATVTSEGTAPATQSSQAATGTPLSTASPIPTQVQTPVPTQAPTPAPTQRTAPSFRQEAHNYQFTKSLAAGDTTVQVIVSGSTPITFSLAQTSSRYIIPEGLLIGVSNGILTFKGGIQPGEYYFTVVASNEVGSARQECKLTVTSLTHGSLLQGFTHTGMLILPVRSGMFSMLLNRPAVPVILKLAADPNATNPAQDQQQYQINKQIQANKQYNKYMQNVSANLIKIRNDHAADLYSTDQFTTNGAPYVQWDSLITLTIEGKKTYYYVHDNMPMNDHHFTQLDDATREKIKKDILEKLTEYNRDDFIWGDKLGLEDMLDMKIKLVSDMQGNLIKDITTILEYGSIIDAMNSSDGGTFDINLDEAAGTFVTGKLFIGLQNNSNDFLNFQQKGAGVKFAGKDVKKASQTDLYNFAFSTGAPNGSAMLSSIDDGQKAFIYSFAYHGQLPGMAAFTVSTSIEAGTKVNVYKFDATSSKFTLIAGGLAVGAQGEVVYNNNTMSEYLVTTQTLRGVSISDVARTQGSLWGISPIYWIAGAAAVVMIAVICLWLFVFRKKRSSLKTGNSSK